VETLRVEARIPARPWGGGRYWRALLKWPQPTRRRKHMPCSARRGQVAEQVPDLGIDTQAPLPRQQRMVTKAVVVVSSDEDDEDDGASTELSEQFPVSALGTESGASVTPATPCAVVVTSVSVTLSSGTPR